MGAFTPDPRVEVAWGFGPYDSPTGGDWVEISDDVNLVETERGRDTELDPFPPGTMMLELDNHDRQFDPLNTTGPHFGDLLENVPIRVVADVGGTDYPIWRGFVDQWPSSYEDGGFNTLTEVPCSDALKLFADRGCPDTFVEDVEGFTGLGTIKRWYRFNEVIPGDPPVIRDIMGNGSTDLIASGQWDNQGRITLSSTLDSLSMPQHKAPENTANKFVGAKARIGPVDNSPIPTDHWIIAFTFRIIDEGDQKANPLELVSLVYSMDEPVTAIDQIVSIGLHKGWSGGGSHHPSAPRCPGCISVAIETNGTSNFHATGPGATNDLTGSAPLAGGTFNPYDGQTHTYILWRKATVLESWVDGHLVGKTTFGGATGVPPWNPNYEIRVYWPLQGQPLNVSNTFPAVAIQELIFLQAPNVSTFVPADWHDVMMTGMHSVVSSGAAVQALLTRVGWPLLQRNIDVGEVLVETPHNPHGQSIMQLLQRYADSEGGRLFVGPDGRVIFHAANRFETSGLEASVQYLFSDTGTDVGVDGELRVVVDDGMVFEAAEMKRADGFQQRAASTSTPNKTFSLDGLLFLNDAQARQRAERILHLYSTSKFRTEEWSVWPEADAPDWDDILELDIGHRVELSLTPRNLGSNLNVEQHLEYIGHVITPIDWYITMNGSPVDDSDYLVWGGTGGTHGWGNGLWR